MDLSISEKYFLLAVNKPRTGIHGYRHQVKACFAASALVDLMLQGCVDLEGRKVMVTAPLTQELAYLAPLYDYLKTKPAVSLSRIERLFKFGTVHKRGQKLFVSVGEHLREKGLVTKSDKRYVVKPEAIQTVLPPLETAFAEQPTIEDITLAVLLDGSHLLQKYLPKAEKKAIRTQLKEIQKQKDQEVQKIAKVIHAMVRSANLRDDVIFLNLLNN